MCKWVIMTWLHGDSNLKIMLCHMTSSLRLSSHFKWKANLMWSLTLKLESQRWHSCLERTVQVLGRECSITSRFVCHSTHQIMSTWVFGGGVNLIMLLLALHARTLAIGQIRGSLAGYMGWMSKDFPAWPLPQTRFGFIDDEQIIWKSLMQNFTT